MPPELLFHHLSESSQDEDDFPYSLDDLVAELPSTDEGLVLVPVILRFMEAHPDLDYGIPGALVHYVERFWNRGYEACLVESVSRHPTMPTLGMLNRLVNGTNEVTSKTRLLGLIKSVVTHPLADSTTQEWAERLLEFHGFSS